jgi:surfactin synthase thioesterase subunit
MTEELMAGPVPAGARPNGAAEWLLTPPGQRPADTLFVVLPYAGIGASLAANLARFLDLRVAVHGLQLPGRENRLSDPPLTSMETVVDGLLPVLAPLVSRPYILMGCSLGALIAYELARRLAALGTPPKHLVVLACAPPQLGRFRTGWSAFDDDTLLAVLDRRFGGVPDIVKENAALRGLFLPALRGDLTLLDSYQWWPAPELNVPLLTIGGTRDPEISAKDLAAWADLTNGPVTHTMVEGGHLVLREDPAAVAALLRAHLGPVVG